MTEDILARIKQALRNRYLIEREIGSGGMAIVYLAHDIKLKRPVAIKVLRPEFGTTLHSELFLQEIEFAASLQHLHILPVHDWDEADGLLYYVMPYVEGESLRQRLDRETQLPLEEAVRITNEIAEGLTYAHAHGIVHRDIKPENILLSNGHAVLADFGVAKAVSRAGGEHLTTAGMALGTPQYMSPEQGTGATQLDGRTDVYALGCVLFEMLAGEPPFSGPTATAIIAKHISETPPSLRVVRPGIPVEIERAINVSLAKVPADRFDTAAHFAEAISQETATAIQQDSGARGELRRTGTRAGLFWTLAVAGGAFAAWLLSDTLRPEGTAETRAQLDPTHLAVLPFEDLSSDGSLSYMTRGLTSDLIDELSAVRALSVTPPSGVRPFAHRAVPIDSIAQTLDVGTLIEGDVSLVNDTVQVSVRLTDVASARQLDSRRLERPYSDFLLLQEDLVTEVALFLRQRLGQEVVLEQRRQRAPNLESWRLVEMAEEAREQANDYLTRGDVRRAASVYLGADSLLVRAESAAPNWVDPPVVRGWIAAGLAEVAHTTGVLTGGGEVLMPDELHALEVAWIDSALTRADRAILLGADHPTALELRGSLTINLLYTDAARTPPELLSRAERDLLAAVTANPLAARAWIALSELHRYRGEFAESARAARKALEADAYLSEPARIMSNLFFTALRAADFAQASEWCNRGRQYHPDYRTFIECELTILGWSGSTRQDVSQAWLHLSEINRSSNPALVETAQHRRLLVAAVLARAGLHDSARAVIRRIRDSETVERTPTSVFTEAYVYTLLGDHETAVSLLGELLRELPQRRDYVAEHPWFSSLRADSEFVALTRGETR